MANRFAEEIKQPFRMKTPEEIKQIQTKLLGVAECLKEWSQRYRGTTDGSYEAFNRAALHCLNGADAIGDLMEHVENESIRTGKMPTQIGGPSEFEPGSLVAKRPVPQCEVLLPTIHGPQRCPCNAIATREWPGNPFKDAGMYGPPVLIQVCALCAKKEIRWTHDGKPYGVPNQ